MKTTVQQNLIVAALIGAVTAITAHAQAAPKMKMTTDIPPSIEIPDKVETRIGTLNFVDGFPDKETTQKVYDNLDFQRAVQSFLIAMPGASEVAIRQGIRNFGPDNQTVLLFETLMDSKSLFLTANTESIYGFAWGNLKDGPMVMETPPRVLGVVDDFWFRYVADFGLVGPDKGQGGKFLLLPPGYAGEIPDGYIVVHCPTINNLLFWRGALVNGDPKPAVESIKQTFRVYPLDHAADAPKMNFINCSGKEMNTVHATDFHFYEEVNQIVQEEPNSAMDMETLGMLASIGIEKGKPFAPDARMTEAGTSSSASTARSNRISTRRGDRASSRK